MPRMKTMTVGPRLHQNRPDISINSGFASSCTGMVLGSNAMPQMGQIPGSDRTISGCMGQVYSVLLFASGSAGSSAIPHLGQGTGLSSDTSGHIGQTYFVVFDPVAAGAFIDRVTVADRYASGSFLNRWRQLVEQNQ